MKIIALVFFILSLSVLQGCTTMYQPLVTSVDNSKITDSDYLHKQKISIFYSGKSPIYNEFEIKNHNYIRTDGKDELSEMGGATASSNMPIASNYALIESLSATFQQVALLSNNITNDYKNYYILKYEIKDVDFAINLYKEDSFFSMPFESGAQSKVTISYELSKNGKMVSKGSVSGNALDKNTKEEHERLKTGANQLLSQSAALLAFSVSIDQDGWKPDPNSKTQQGRDAYQRRSNIIQNIYNTIDKHKYNINENKFKSLMTPGDIKLFNDLVTKYKGSLQDPPEGLSGADKGLAWFSPNNFAMRRSLMSSTEKALEKLINNIIRDINKYKT